MLRRSESRHLSSDFIWKSPKEYTTSGHPTASYLSSLAATTGATTD